MGREKGRNNRLRQISVSKPTASKQDFQHGPYYSGSGGYTFLSDEPKRRIFTPGLCPGELLTLQLLNIQAWSARSLVVEAAATYLALQMFPVLDLTSLPRDKKGRLIVPGERTVRRYLASLIRQEYLRLEKRGHLKEGNRYFVEPVLIWDSKWHELAGIETAACVRTSNDFPNIWFERWCGQNGSTGVGAAKMAAQCGQNGSTGIASVGTRCGQNGLDPRSRSSDPTAQCVIALNETGGGADGERFEGALGEGVALTGDESIGSHTPFNVATLPGEDIPIYNAKVRALAKDWLNKKISEEVYKKAMAELNAEYGKGTIFVDRAKPPKKKKPVGNGRKSNFHARV